MSEQLSVHQLTTMLAGNMATVQALQNQILSYRPIERPMDPSNSYCICLVNALNSASALCVALTMLRQCQTIRDPNGTQKII